MTAGAYSGDRAARYLTRELSRPALSAARGFACTFHRRSLCWNGLRSLARPNSRARYKRLGFQSHEPEYLGLDGLGQPADPCGKRPVRPLAMGRSGRWRERGGGNRPGWRRWAPAALSTCRGGARGRLTTRRLAAGATMAARRVHRTSRAGEGDAEVVPTLRNRGRGCHIRDSGGILARRSPGTAASAAKPLARMPHVRSRRNTRPTWHGPHRRRLARRA